MAMYSNDKIVWIDNRTATFADDPDIIMVFAENDDEEKVDAVLGMLLQARITHRQTRG